MSHSRQAARFLGRISGRSRRFAWSARRGRLIRDREAPGSNPGPPTSRSRSGDFCVFQFDSFAGAPEPSW